MDSITRGARILLLSEDGESRSPFNRARIARLENAWSDLTRRIWTATNEGIFEGAYGNSAAARSALYRGTKRTRRQGEEEGAGGVGVRGKPGSKARRNFQQSRSLCWRAAKGVASHVRIMLVWRIPFLPSPSRHAHASRCVCTPVVKIALQVKTSKRDALSLTCLSLAAFVNRTTRLRYACTRVYNGDDGRANVAFSLAIAPPLI